MSGPWRRKPPTWARPLRSIGHLRWRRRSTTGTGSISAATLGWAFGDASVTYNPTGATWDVGKNGFLGGVQAGVNWQTGAFVFGIEGEFDWINGKSSRSLLVGPAAGLWGDGGTTWMATIAGRAGIAVDNVLWYAKGGAGWVENTATIYNGNGTTLWTGSNTPVGWLIGAGVEVGLAPNWTAKLEYQYLNLRKLDRRSEHRGAAAGFRVGVARHPDPEGGLQLQVLTALRGFPARFTKLQGH